MAHKPTITYSCSENGDENLVLTLSTHLRSLLIDHSVTWERSYGRIPRKISLDAKLLPLTTALLDRNDLVTRPYFHLFWTNCNDSDYYRSTVKEEISSWMSEIGKHGSDDWLIVHVSGEGVSRSSKPKLQLTRSSMSDRLKNDFCPKHPERIQTLQDPLKESAKSSESWSALCSKLVSLAVICIEKAVSAYEEKVRSERERRNELSWNFCKYFALQEELAFMFEMLNLFDEALIQYDELDAMFTQYLINAQAGDIAHWLSTFSDPIKQWHPLSLWRKVDGDARNKIVQCNATIIDIRNYLFSRHCHLLIKSGQLSKVTERMYIFLHSLETEIEILEIIMPPGSIECWLFMSCLELSQTLKRKSDQLTSENEVAPTINMTYDQIALETANLCDLARKKLYKLADICGLLPHMVPSSQQLNHVVDLIAGIGDDEDRGDKFKPPALILRECLSSQQNLYKQYLELSEQAIGIYKHTGRFRTARTIGGDLALFYMLSSKPEKAESFLVDSVRMYTNEGWENLASKTSQHLAKCSKYLCKIRRYIRLCCTLMCDSFISMDERLHYLNEISSNSSDVGDIPLAIMLSTFAHVSCVKFVPAKTHYHVEDEEFIYITIISTAPALFKFQRLQISLRCHGTSDAHWNHDVNKLHEDQLVLDEDLFSEEDMKDKNITIITTANLGLDTPKKMTKKKRYISSCSYDGIANTHHANKLNKDGMVKLMSMDNSVCKGKECHLKQSHDVLNLSQESEIELNDIVSYASIVCCHAHQLLRRQDSSQSTRSLQFGATNIVMDSYAECLETQNIVLHPGKNVIRVNVKTSTPGEYSLTQLRFTINKVHFVLPRILPNISYIVNKQLPRVETKTPADDNLTCGILNEMEIIFKNGDFAINDETKHLKLSSSRQIKILNKFQCTIKSNEDVELRSEVITATELANTWLLKLPPCPVLSTIVIAFSCKVELPEMKDKEVDVKLHRRSHSAPVIKAMEEKLAINAYNDNVLKQESTPPIKQLAPMLPPFERESPVKKFLSFMREVAGDHKKDDLDSLSINKLQSSNSSPSSQLNDDMIEVTLEEEDVVDKNETFPRLPKKLRPNFTFMGHRKSRSDVSSIVFNKDTVQFTSDRSESPQSFSLTSSPSIQPKSPILTLPRTPPEEKPTFVIDDSAVDNDKFADVIVEEEDQSLICPITVEFPWEQVNSVTQKLKFVWPIEFTHRLRNVHIPGNSVANHRIITVTIKNICNHRLAFSRADLKLMKVKHMFVKSLNMECEYDILKDETVNFSWKITSGVELKSPMHLNLRMIVEMNTFLDELWTPVYYNFQVENIKTLYIISTEVGKGEPIHSGETTILEIKVQRIRLDPEQNEDVKSYQMLMFKVLDTRGHWAVCERSSGLVSMPPAQLNGSDMTPVTSKTSLEIMPLVHGYLHRPNVQIFRYYKRDSSEYDEQLSSTDSPVLKPPRLREFMDGEVINTDKAMQVQVLPATQESSFTEATHATSIAAF